MTQEDKKLLLNDLCSRLAYGVVLNVGDKDIKLDRRHQNIGVMYPEDCTKEFNERNGCQDFYIVISGCYYGEDIKPYLRSITNITDEEATELGKLTGSASYNLLKTNYNSLQKLLEFVYQHHIDMFGLIDKGLALEAPEDMYNF